MLKGAVAFLLAFAVCWALSRHILAFLLEPIRQHLFEGDEIVFINLSEPFMIYMKSAALVALFVSSPFLLYQIWAFVAPGLYRREARMLIPFLIFGSLFFAAGGAFGYYVAVPVASRWLIRLGQDYTANITLRSAFQFESLVILGMGLVWELPVMIFFLARLGVVTPKFLMSHFRTAVLAMALLSAVITPTGDVLTMSVFAGPMILLYLLGVLVAWLAERRDGS